MEESIVYFTRKITPESLINIYNKLGVELKGNIGIKVSTGEKGAKGYLKANLIGPFVKMLNGTIIECNTAYPGARTNTADHLKVAEDHGFKSIANVDIMDSEGEETIPVWSGMHLEYNIVGTHLKNYDAMVNLAHGKGHQMGGFGANIKNQSIGVASRNGKAYIHSCAQTSDPNKCWSVDYKQIDFIESMAEAAKSVADFFKNNNKQIVYITIMNDISLGCDCEATQGDPIMNDIGIIASLDPVANDQAFIDFIWKSTEEGAKLLRERIDKLEARHITAYAEKLGLGTTKYKLIDIDSGE